MDLSSFKILKEYDDAYEIGHPNGKSLRVSKSGLRGKAQKLVEKLKSKQHLASGGEVEGEAPAFLAANPTSQQMQEMEKASMPTQAPAQTVVPEQAQPMVANKEIVPAQQTDHVQRPQQQSPDQLINQKNKGIVGALQTQEGFMREEAKAHAAQAAEEAKLVGQTNAKIELLDTANNLYSKYQAKDQQLAKDLMDAKIDPNRYLNSRNTGQKLAQAIGLFLGGIGAGMTHTENDSVKIIQSAIDRDIDAQKSDQSNKMNLWKMNREAYGNELQANLATQNQLYTGLKYQLQQQASKYASPIAQARAGQGIATIDQQIAQNNQKMAFMDMGLGKGTVDGKTQAADPSVLVPHLVPENRQKEVFDEIERAQNTKHASPAILDAFDKAAQESRVFSGGGLKAVGYALPFAKAPHAKALQAEMGPTFSKLEGTVRQAAMDNMDHNITPAFGDSDETIKVKRQALQNYLESAKAAPTAKGFGIDLSKFSSTAVDNAKPDIKTMNGVQYQKVQGGWKKVN